MANEIVILIYHHDYGHDIGVYATVEDAKRAAGDIIVEYFNEIDSANNMECMLDLLRNKEYDKAMDLWQHLSCDTEYFEITTRGIYSDVPHPKLFSLKKIIDEQRQEEQCQGE